MLADRRLGLAGNAAFETYSVLTRLPPPARPSSDCAAAVLADLPGHAVTGGAVYDALVGAAAREHGLALVSLAAAP